MAISQFEFEQQLRTFGAALRRARKRAGVSKRRMAVPLSNDRSAIKEIEQGERAPNFGTLLVLAYEAKTTPVKLLAGIGPKRSPIPKPKYSGEPPRDPLLRFGANLTWVRERCEAFENKSGLAWESEVDLPSLGRYESGKMAPNLRRILRMAGALGISPSLLFEGVALDECAMAAPADLDRFYTAVTRRAAKRLAAQGARGSARKAGVGHSSARPL